MKSATMWYRMVLAVLVGLAAFTSGASASSVSVCPAGHSGFVVTDMCSGVAWCSEGVLHFYQPCDAGSLFDPTSMACVSEATGYTCPTHAPTSSPTVSKKPTARPTRPPVTASPTAGPTDRPSEGPSGAPVTAAPTDAPPPSEPPTQPHPFVRLVPTDAELLAAAFKDPPPTPAPTPGEPVYKPVTATVQGTRFEVAISGLPTYLFHKAFAKLNTILDGMVVTNLDLPMGIKDIQFNTILVSQGIKRRNVAGQVSSVSPLTDTVFYPGTSALVSRDRTQRDEVQVSGDDFKPPLLRRRLEVRVRALGEDEEAEEGAVAREDTIAGSERKMQQATNGATLFAIMSKKMYVTVAATGPDDQHDASLIPTREELNGAIATVFRDETQKSLFASWLRAGTIQEFHNVEQVDFVGFVDESWASPDFSMSMEPLLVETHWGPGVDDAPAL